VHLFVTVHAALPEQELRRHHGRYTVGIVRYAGMA
jgi:hypothetical protein